MALTSARGPSAVWGVILLTLGSLGCDPSPDRTQPVGRTVLGLEDSTRTSWTGADSRPLLTTLWYPASTLSEEAAWELGIFRFGWSAVDAPLAETPSRMPLVVLSHGTGGAAAQLSWLAEALSTQGYLVAAVNHHGNTAAEESYSPLGFALWWERALDVRAVIDQLLADPNFGDRIDPSRIGMAGYSLGGFTAALAAGARIDRAQWIAHCEARPASSACALPPESPFSMAEVLERVAGDPTARASISRAGDSYRDDRIRAVFLIAPVLTAALDSASLASIGVPVDIAVGELDAQATPDDNARVLHDRIPGSELSVLPGVTHYTLLAPCTLRGRLLVRPLCGDEGGVSRAAIHREVAADARSFFDLALAEPALEDSASSQGPR